MIYFISRAKDFWIFERAIDWLLSNSFELQFGKSGESTAVSNREKLSNREDSYIIILSIISYIVKLSPLGNIVKLYPIGNILPKENIVKLSPLGDIVKLSPIGNIVKLSPLDNIVKLSNCREYSSQRKYCQIVSYTGRPKKNDA